jgi:BlaI family penicillinase repressor
MNEIPKISDSEWQVMKIIWERTPITSNEIVKELKALMKWRDTTIYTLISRLANKNIIEIDKEVSPNLCRPLVSQQECIRDERQSFIKKIYNGSLSLMLANFVEEDELTDEDVKELKSILDNKQSRGNK